MNLKQYILEERKFLHDISNHIVVVEGMLASGLKKLEQSTEYATELEKLNKSLSSAVKIRESAVARKRYVEQIQDSIVD